MENRERERLRDIERRIIELRITAQSVRNKYDAALRVKMAHEREMKRLQDEREALAQGQLQFHVA